MISPDGRWLAYEPDESGSYDPSPDRLEGQVVGTGLKLNNLHAKRPPRQRLRCVLGMLSSLGVQVPRPT